MNAINPFQEKPAPTTALSNREANAAIAEVQAAMMIARMNPRNQKQAMDHILNACTRQSLAESAIYNFSRGGSEISGPSIRLAETIAQSWGNLQYGIRELDSDNDESTVQAYCWDVETNTKREITFTVRNERDTKQGKKKLTDSRDLYENMANQGARRLRACILSVIPGDVVEAAVGQCDLTLKSTADVSPESIKKMIAAFDKFGVNQAQIEKFIQRRIDTIQPAQIIRLKKVYASIKDGMSAPNDWFEAVQATHADDPINQAMTGKKVDKTTPPDKWPDLIKNAQSKAEIMAIMKGMDDAEQGLYEADLNARLDALA